MAREPKIDQHKRLGEIIEVLRRNEITREMTPEKLCAVMEELGPTFIKLGQILSMRSDFLPAAYCEALTRLRTQVEPMPYEQVEAILEGAYGHPLQDIFASFDQSALGSASIAQVHSAELVSGEKVVVKVQRQGIHETMNRDIVLLKKAAEVVKYTPHKSLVDFNRVLDEMWIVAQQEMNFLTEAQNLEKFAQMNKEVAYISVPKLFPNYCTSTTLVMERIFGVPIDDHEALLKAGYDLNEIGSKLADNYVKQITEDGFFHADPHPGNIRVQDGKIVYLDMGMMGTLSEKDRKTISQAVEGVARNNPEVCMDAVLQLGVEGDEILIKSRHFQKIRQDAGFKISIVLRILGIPGVMLGDPPGSPHPVHDHRHHLIGRGNPGRGARRHVQALHAEQLLGVILKGRDAFIVIPEKGFVEGQQIPGEHMPVNHLDVFIGHVVGPHEPVIPRPQAVHGKGIGLGIGTADEQIPPVAPQLFDQLHGLLSAVRLQKQFFIAVPFIWGGQRKIRAAIPSFVDFFMF